MPTANPADIVTSAAHNLADVLRNNVKTRAKVVANFADLKRLQQILSRSQICEPEEAERIKNNNQTNEPAPRVDIQSDTPPPRVRDTVAHPRVPLISPSSKAAYPTEHPTFSPAMNTRSS